MNKLLSLDITKYLTTTLAVLSLIYLFFYIRVSEEEAKIIALETLNKRYDITCGWGFETNLVMKVNDDWSFEFLSENEKCELYILVHKYWYVESGIMPKK